MMKNRTIGIILFLVFFLMAGLELFPAEAKVPRVYFKFKGSGSLAAGGDFGDFLDRSETNFKGLNNTPGYTVTVTRDPFFRAFGGEIGVDTKKFAVGLSVEYFKKNFRIEYQYDPQNSSFEENYTRDHTFSALPIFLFLHYKIVNSRSLTIFATIGEGVFLTRYRDDWQQTFKNHTITYANTLLESKKNYLGFHIGTTIDLNISSHLALSVEAAYRFANFKDMTAESYYQDDDLEVETEGDFYYWIDSAAEEGRFAIGAPTGKTWEGEPAKLNLNGFSLSVGIKITLGSKKKAQAPKVAPVE